jgi:uncharacterized protein (DUF488 family)
MKSRQTPKQGAPISVYTIGYEGATVESFLETCRQNGIAQILDVRNNPWSRKPGFSKKALAESCAQAGIEYRHLPELGIPRSQRQEVNTPEGRRAVLDRYEKEILPHQREAIAQALALVKEKPTALLCLEADANLCHRGRLARELARISGLPVRHLKLGSVQR